METSTEADTGTGVTATLSQQLARHLQAAVTESSSDKSRLLLVTSLIPQLLTGLAEIAHVLRNVGNVGLAGTANAFGDTQLNVDMLAEGVMRKTLGRCPEVFSASSEELPVENPIHSLNRDLASTSSSASSSETAEKYSVAFDPLDGSSIIAPNWTVGTIIGVWDGRTALIQDPRKRQVVSILGVIGPRTTAIIAIRTPTSPEPACFEVSLTGSVLDDSLLWEVTRPRIRLNPPPFQTRYFAPANLRSAAEDPRYMELITHYIGNKYTLRYSGGLVPDIVHALVKGHGIYINPVTAKSTAKLRRLYELLPIAMVIECAGGKAIDPVTGEDILDREVKGTDERGGLVCGTVEEVDFVWQKLSG